MDESFTPSAETETWLPVPSWEGFYEVSDKSRVRSVPRLILVRDGHKRQWPGRVINQWPSHHGHPAVTMQAYGRQENVAVHLLVQQAFGLTPTPNEASDTGKPERWLSAPVPGFEDLYEVSDLGRVRSLPRKTASGLRGGRVLGFHVGNTGYPAVMLYRNNKPVRKHVHSLVLGAFVGPCPPGHEALHGPAGPLVAALRNLAWGTREKNQGPDKVRDGTSNRGERQGRHKLTWVAVAEIRRRAAAGEPKMHLAREFGVSASNLRSVIRGDTWRVILLRPIKVEIRVVRQRDIRRRGISAVTEKRVVRIGGLHEEGASADIGRVVHDADRVRPPALGAHDPA